MGRGFGPDLLLTPTEQFSFNIHPSWESFNELIKLIRIVMMETCSDEIMFSAVVELPMISCYLNYVVFSPSFSSSFDRLTYFQKQVEVLDKVRLVRDADAVLYHAGRWVLVVQFLCRLPIVRPQCFTLIGRGSQFKVPLRWGIPYLQKSISQT